MSGGRLKLGEEDKIEEQPLDILLVGATEGMRFDSFLWILTG